MDGEWGATFDAALKNRKLSLDDGKSIVEVYEPAPGIIHCRMRGVFCYSHALELARVSSQSTAPIIHYFSDWEFMESYESQARSTMADWGRYERKRLKSGTFICGNRIVEMGVTVAGLGMALLGIEIKATTREDFNAKLTARCAGEEPVCLGSS